MQDKHIEEFIKKSVRLFYQLPRTKQHLIINEMNLVNRESCDDENDYFQATFKSVYENELIEKLWSKIQDKTKNN